MKFVTLFPATEDMHLAKDVGLLPYYLFKTCGAEASIATCNNSGSYMRLESDVPGLKLEFIKKTRFGRIADGLRYIKENAEAIDVLNIYHLNLSSYFWASAFKRANRRGAVYMKLDMDHLDLIGLKRPGLKRIIKNATLKNCDVISCESTYMREELEKLPVFKGREVLYIADGLCRAAAVPEVGKENVFLTAGRLGCEQKATEVLLEAFALSADEHSWSLRLAGGKEPGFEARIEDYFRRNPGLRQRVSFLGSITDKAELNRQYALAKVFVLPSRWESFGIVLTEAAACGCYILTTDVVPSARDITDGWRFGETVPAEDPAALARAMINCTKKELGEDGAKAEKEYIYAAFNWEREAEKLYAALSSALENIRK